MLAADEIVRPDLSSRTSDNLRTLFAEYNGINESLGRTIERLEALRVTMVSTMRTIQTNFKRQETDEEKNQQRFGELTAEYVAITNDIIQWEEKRELVLQILEELTDKIDSG
jgi:hypothetical protein